MEMRLTTQEAVMGQAIPRQHPAVVLRSHYKAVLAMLCVSLVAIVALSTALVIVANDDNEATIAAQPSAQPQTLPPGTRFDGGPDEGTRGIVGAQPAPLAPGTRFDGGPDEGTRGIVGAQPAPLAPGTRFDGGPDEGTRGPQSYWESSNPRTSYQPAPSDGFKERAGGPSIIPSPQPSDAQSQTMGARP
jgi:hypothetical protein